MIEYALVRDPGKPLRFQPRSEDAKSFFRENPRLRAVIRAASRIYRGKVKDECTTVAMARDLESMFRAVTGMRVSIRPMEWKLRTTAELVDPQAREMTFRVRSVLVDLRA